MPEISQGLSRAQYYDRNPIVRSRSYFTSGIAPGGSVNRWSYTVPAGKKCYVQSAMCQLRRATVAAPAGQTESDIAVTTFADGLTAHIIVTDRFGNVVDQGDSLAVAGIGLYNAGDIINALSFDNSTAGTVCFGLAITLVEYDA